MFEWKKWNRYLTDWQIGNAKAPPFSQQIYHFQLCGSCKNHCFAVFLWVQIMNYQLYTKIHLDQSTFFFFVYLGYNPVTSHSKSILPSIHPRSTVKILVSQPAKLPQEFPLAELCLDASLGFSVQ